MSIVTPTREGHSPVLPEIVLRKDRMGDPFVSASFVLSRQPDPDDRLGPLVTRASLALEIEVIDRRSDPNAHPDGDAMLVGEITAEVISSTSGAVVASQTTAGPFASVALHVGVEGHDAAELLASLVGGAESHKLRIQAVIPGPPPEPTTVQTSLLELWTRLDQVADESRRFYETDLLNYLPELTADAVVQVESGSRQPRSVLSALVRGAPTLLIESDETSTDRLNLGPVYKLSPIAPVNMAVTSTQATSVRTDLICAETDLASLVGPAIAHDRERFVHLVTAAGGRLDNVLPARTMRSARGSGTGSFHVAIGDKVTSLHAAIEPRPAALSAIVSSGLLSTVIHDQLVVASDLSYELTPVRQPGPIVTTLDGAMWRDRADDDVTWYVPEFHLVLPDPLRAVDDGTPFRFDVEPVGGHDLAGNVGISASVTVTVVARRSPATLAAWSAAGEPDLRPVKFTGGRIHLAVPFRDEDGTTRVESVSAESTLPAGIDLADGALITARFNLLDRWARMAYGALSTEGFQAAPARIVVAGAFEGWRTRRSAPVITGLHKQWAMFPHRAAPRGVHGRPARPTVSNLASFSVHQPTANAATLLALSAANVSLQPAWHIRPDLMGQLDQNVYEWSEFAITRSLDVEVPCGEYATSYRELADDGAWDTIGCRPALQLGQTEYRTYEPVEVASAEGRARVYRSLRTPGRFLVVPLAYAVGRHEPETERAYQPSMVLHSTIDIENPTNIRCVLAASLQPDLPPFVRDAIESELRATAHPAPTLEYLSDCGVPATTAWAAPGNVEIQTVQTASGFEVVCSTDPAGFLVLRSILERGGLRGTASVELPSGVAVSTDLALSLTTVTGPFEAGPLDLTPTRGGTLRITNRTGQRIAAHSIASNGIEIADIDQAIGPGDDIEIEHPEAPWPFHVAYDVDTGSEVLDEVRAYIEDLDIGVVFVAASDPSDAGLVGLEVSTQLLDLAAEPIILTSDDRQIEQRFVLPLTQFVDDPTLVFTVAAIAEDGSRVVGAPVNWRLHSQGALIPIGPPE